MKCPTCGGLQLTEWPHRHRKTKEEPAPVPRTDTERLDALEKMGRELMYSSSEWAVDPGMFNKYRWRPTLRAAIDAYLDAEQKKGGDAK